MAEYVINVAFYTPWCRGKNIMGEYEKTGDDYLAALGEEREEEVPDRMSFTDYVDWVLEEPERAGFGTPAEFLYRAVEEQGTRTVVEQGEERERYRAFDDPRNDGEHAVLGNTPVLNEMVRYFKKVAKNDKAKIPFIFGPTATGKSELLWNLEAAGIAYGKTDDGQLYMPSVPNPEVTLHSNYMQGHEVANWDEGGNEDRSEYVDSPIRIDPLSLFAEYAEEQAEALEERLNAARRENGNPMNIQIPERVDPATKDILGALEDKYDDMTMDELIDEYVDVVPVELDRGNGIGQLTSSTEFTRFKNEIIGGYPMGVPAVPRNYQFTGAFSNGTPVMTRLDDSDQYGKYLGKLNELIDKQEETIQSGEPVYLDTMPILIANPDFAKRLGAEFASDAPTEVRMEQSFAVLDNSLERRMKLLTMGYLTNYAYESELIRKQLDKDWDLLDDVEQPEDALDVIHRPMFMEYQSEDDGDVTVYEFAPHAVEAGAMAEVITRLDDEQLPGKNEDRWDERDMAFPENSDGAELTLREKLELFQQGYIERQDNGDEDKYIRLEKDDFAFPEGWTEYGFDGIPVTYTEEVFEDLLEQDFDRNATEELDVSNVITAYNVLDAMIDGMDDEAEISSDHIDEFEELITGEVEPVITDRYMDDVLDAVFGVTYPSRDTVSDYVTMLQDHRDDNGNGNGNGNGAVNGNGEDDEVDPLTLKETEKRSFNFSDDHYDGTDPEEDVEAFREAVHTQLSRLSWENRDNGDDEFSLDEYIRTHDMREEIDEIQSRIGHFDWDSIEDVQDGRYEGFQKNLTHWDNQKLVFTDKDDLPTDAEIDEFKDPTKRLKNAVVRNMVADQDYSVASAYVVAREVFDRQFGAA